MAYEITRDENDFVAVNGIIVAWIGGDVEYVMMNAKGMIELSKMVSLAETAEIVDQIFAMKPSAPKTEGALWQD